MLQAACWLVALYLLGASALPLETPYHTTDQVLGFFQTAAKEHSNFVKYQAVPDSESNANLPLVTITDFAADTPKEVVLLVAGEHPQELIGAEILFWLGHLFTSPNELEDWPAYQPVQASAWKAGWTKTTLAEWAVTLLKVVEFRILPVASILGRQAVEAGNSAHCQHLISSGVDLWRNWPQGWQKAEPGSPDYGGPYPLSTPEARIIKLAADTASPHAFIALQSGAWALHTPEQQRGEKPTGADTRELLDKLNTYCQCGTSNVTRAGAWSEGGTAMAYLSRELHVPYAMSWQVYGPHEGSHLATAEAAAARRLLEEGEPEAVAASPQLEAAAAESQVRPQVLAEGEQSDGCLHAFNPGKEEYEEVVARWVGALLVVADHVGARPRGNAASRQAHQSQLPLPPTPPFKQDLERLGKTAVEEHQNPGTFVKDAQTQAAQGVAAALLASREQAAGDAGLQQTPPLRRAQLLAQSDLHTMGQDRIGVQPTRSLLGPALALLAVLTLVGGIVARVGAAKGFTPGALRGASRRGAARRQGRSL